MIEVSPQTPQSSSSDQEEVQASSDAALSSQLWLEFRRDFLPLFDFTKWQPIRNKIPDRKLDPASLSRDTSVIGSLSVMWYAWPTNLWGPSLRSSRQQINRNQMNWGSFQKKSWVWGFAAFSEFPTVINAQFQSVYIFSNCAGPFALRRWEHFWSFVWIVRRPLYPYVVRSHLYPSFRTFPSSQSPSGQPSSGSRGFWGHGPPLPPRLFKIMQFSGNFKGKTPILSKVWAQAPLWIQNSTMIPWPKSWIRACNLRVGIMEETWLDEYWAAVCEKFSSAAEFKLHAGVNTPGRAKDFTPNSSKMSLFQPFLNH